MTVNDNGKKGFKYVFLKRTLQKHPTNNSVTSKHQTHIKIIQQISQTNKKYIQLTQQYNHETSK